MKNIFQAHIYTPSMDEEDASQVRKALRELKPHVFPETNYFQEIYRKVEGKISEQKKSGTISTIEVDDIESATGAIRLAMAKLQEIGVKEASFKIEKIEEWKPTGHFSYYFTPRSTYVFTSENMSVAGISLQDLPNIAREIIDVQFKGHPSEVPTPEEIICGTLPSLVNQQVNRITDVTSENPPSHSSTISRTASFYMPSLADSIQVARARFTNKARRILGNPEVVVKQVLVVGKAYK